MVAKQAKLHNHASSENFKLDTNIEYSTTSLNTKCVQRNMKCMVTVAVQRCIQFASFLHMHKKFDATMLPNKYQDLK